MTNPSNARYLGHIISEPLQIVKHDQRGLMPFDHKTPVAQEDLLEGDAPEPDPEELPDQDWAAQPTEYDPS